MADHPHPHDDLPEPVAPERPIDPGSQALAEALRSSFGIVKVVMVVLLLVFLGSGFFTVGPQERAIILRLGKPVGEGEKALLGPGLHLSFPYPIDEYMKVSISGPQTVMSSVGWYFTTPAMEAAGTEPMPGASLNPAVDGYLLTADGNIIHSRATLTYHIKDPNQYLFAYAGASNAVMNALDDALLRAAARFKVDDIITRERAAFTEAVQRGVTELAAQRNLGIEVEQCAVNSIPPRQLKMAFDNVLKAEVTRNKVLDDARSYQNQVLSRANADSQSRINAAESERTRLVAEVSSRADQFNELLPKYRANPELFVQKRLQESLATALPGVQEKIYLTESGNGQPKELRLLLNREPPKPKTEEKK